MQETLTQREPEAIAKDIKESKQTRDFKKYEIDNILNQDKVPLKIGSVKDVNVFLKKHGIKNTDDFNNRADRLNITKIGNTYYQVMRFNRGQFQ